MSKIIDVMGVEILVESTISYIDSGIKKKTLEGD